MPATVTSDLFLSAANILALKVGNNNVSKAYLGETLMFETNFGSSGFQWMTINSVTASTAAGIGQNNITVAITQSGGGMEPHSGMYAAQTFPAEYGVPTGGIQIKNVAAGIFTAVFSQPVTDALVAFASVGQAGTPVTVMVLDEFNAPKPFTPIWSLTSEPWSQTTYQNPVNATQYTQFIGEEGYNIIRVDGAMSSVTFNYTVSENYCTVCFGFVDQNAPPIPGCTDPTANNYNLNATVDDGSCQYCNYGCTDGGANNYNPEATCDDGSCYFGPYFSQCDGDACTSGNSPLAWYRYIDSSGNFIENHPDYGNDPGLPNYNDLEHCACGCTDPSANNYDPNARIDNGSCAYDIYGCTDEEACYYNPDANISNGECGGYVGCTDPSALNYDSGASCGSNAYRTPDCCYDQGNIQYYFAGCEACGFGNFDYEQYDSCGNMFYRGFVNFLETNLCDHLCVDGCTDSAANNYNPDATRNDGSCCYDNSFSSVTCDSCGTVMVYIFDSCGNLVNGYLDVDYGSCDHLCPGYYGCTDYLASNYNPNSMVDDGSCFTLLRSYGGFVNYGASGMYKFWPYNDDQDPTNFTLSCLGITWTVDSWQTRNSYGAFFEYSNNPLDHLDEFAINPNMNLRDDGYGLAPISYTDGINGWIQAAGASNYVQMLIATEDTGDGVVKGRTIIKLMGVARTNPNFRMRLAFVENYSNGSGDFTSPMTYVLNINEPSGDAIPSAGDWADINLGVALGILQSSSDEGYNKQWGLP